MTVAALVCSADGVLAALVAGDLDPDAAAIAIKDRAARAAAAGSFDLVCRRCGRGGLVVQVHEGVRRDAIADHVADGARRFEL